MRLAAFVLGLAATSFVERIALADGAESEARRLFEQGIAFESSQKPAEACAKFRASLAVVREVGPLRKTKECDVREAKLLAAKADLEELIRRWPEPGPELDGFKAELSAVEKRIPHLTVKLSKDAPAGVRARVDGNAVDLPANAMALDPGDHELLVEVPGRALASLKLTLLDGEVRTVEVPEPAAAQPLPPPVPPKEANPSGLHSLGIAGLIVGGVGVLGFVGAGVSGALVLDKQSEFEACRDQGECPQGSSLSELSSQGETLLIANGVLWGIGIAGVGVGATLLIVDLVTGEPATKPSVEASFGPGRAALRVHF